MDMSQLIIASNQSRVRKILVVRIYIKRKINNKSIEITVSDRTIACFGGFFNSYILTEKVFQGRMIKTLAL